MTWNMSYLTDYEEIDGGYVTFGSNLKGGKITNIGTIITGNLDFKNVYFVRELKFNLFSISQMCDKKNSVLFNDTECIVLSPNFKLNDESHVLLKVPRKNNMYSVDLKNVVPKGGLTYLFAKATSDESELWHRRLGHINFKTMNKLVKGNLIRDDYSRFSWVFFLATKDETSGILKSFITGVENLIDQRVKAARTMLADSKLPTTFWAEAVNTACYVQNRVLVTKPHNKTPYELFLGRKPTLGFMKPFGCPVLILNTIDHFGKFDGKADEGFFVGYSINRSGPNWLFDIDALTKSLNYKPVITGNQSNGNAGTKVCDDAGKARMEIVPGKDYILLPLWTADPPFSQSSKSSPYAGFKSSSNDGKKDDEEPRKFSEFNAQEKEDNDNNTNNVNAANINKVNVVGTKTSIELPIDPDMPELEDIVYSDDNEDVGAEANMNNLDAFIHVSPIPTTRVHKDHPVEQIIGDLNSAPQTRRMTKNLEEHGLFSSVQKRTNHKDFQNCLFACFLSQEEPKKVINALKDPSWIEAMQEELLQFNQDKYVTKILKKFGFTNVKTASTPMETQKPLLKDEDSEEVDVHMYQSMIGSLMYLTSSRPDIMFAVYSPFDLVAYTDSDYARVSLDRKSTTGSCQFLRSILISWQYKKQTVVANSTIEAEYVVKNHVFHSKTKHIEIRHHFIRDSNEKKLIQMIKIYTDKNVADLLTKAFDVSRFQYLIASIGMLNL
ncbi:uncharacterized mitochondrial protein-like protein [Tanacetum coccineum]